MKEIRVIGYITNTKKGKCRAVSNDYLSKEKDLPFESMQEMKSNGWQDEDGMVWWGEDFQPDPIIGSDGNVYICISDFDMSDISRRSKRMFIAKKMFLDTFK